MDFFEGSELGEGEVMEDGCGGGDWFDKLG